MLVASTGGIEVDPGLLLTALTLPPEESEEPTRKVRQNPPHTRSLSYQLHIPHVAGYRLLNGGFGPCFTAGFVTIINIIIL